MKEGAVISISQDGTRAVFECPGCGDHHGVWIADTPGDKPRGLWTWNGSREKPTFTPSILAKRTMHEPPVTPENIDEWRLNPWKQTPVEHICHSFVTDGKIQFLGDCTHALAGQTVELQPEPECVHQWVTKRMGGSPSNADSDERIRYCDLCGVEYEGD